MHQLLLLKHIKKVNLASVVKENTDQKNPKKQTAGAMLLLKQI